MEPAANESKPETNSKSVGLAFFWSMVGNGFGQGLSLLLFLLIAKFVSPESFGLMAVSLMTIEIARRLILDPIAITLKSKQKLSDHDLDNAFTAILLASALLALLLVFLSVPLGYVLGTPEIANYLPFVAPILLGFGLTKVHDVWLSRAMNYRALALRNMIAVLGGGAVGITMALNGFQIWSLVGQQLTISLASVITLWAVTPWRPKLVLSVGWIAEHVKQSGHHSISNLWTSLSQDSDIYFVSAILGPVAAGLFSASRRILLAVTITLTFTIQSVSMAALANIADEERRAQSMLGGLAATCLVTSPAFAGLSLIAVDIVVLVLPSQWSYAGQILSVLAIGGVALTLHTLAGSILSVEQRADLNNLCSGITAIIAIAAYTLAAEYGLLTMAWAVVATSLVTLPLRYYLVQKQVGVSAIQIYGATVPALVASAMMYALTSFTVFLLEPELGIASLSIKAALGVVIYAAVLWAVFRPQFRLLVDAVSQQFRSSPADI
jgi:O-antigen/teichoic acid export membrane protein